MSTLGCFPDLLCFIISVWVSLMIGLKSEIKPKLLKSMRINFGVLTAKLSLVRVNSLILFEASLVDIYYIVKAI